MQPLTMWDVQSLDFAPMATLQVCGPYYLSCLCIPIYVLNDCVV